MLGLVGKKLGMSRWFSDTGESRPVTVIEVLPNRVSQVKSEDSDGYRALQITTGERREKRVTGPARGHFAKAGVAPGRMVREFRIEAESEYQPGAELTADLFQPGQRVDVTGRSIGKGFAGGMKRHGFGGGRASHGNSKAHRLPGSIGNAQDPGRIFKGKKMAGHMGAVRRTQQNLTVLEIDAERQLIFIQGSIPGACGSDVLIRPAVKHPAPEPQAKQPEPEAEAPMEAEAEVTEAQAESQDAPEAAPEDAAPEEASTEETATEESTPEEAATEEAATESGSDDAPESEDTPESEDKS